MKYLKHFEQISGRINSGSIDPIVVDYCLGHISESEFIDYLESDILNEGLLDVVKGFKDKLVDIFYTFVVKAYQIGLAIYDKVSSFMKWLINKIKNYREKNPTTYRIIVITIIVIVLLIVSASTAKAATSGTPVPAAKIDMAIGWLDNLKGKEDPMLLNKAIAHLVDIRDGSVDIQNIGSQAINMSNAALSTADKIMAEAKTQTDPAFFKFCCNLIETGRNYIDAIYTKSGGFESIKLVIK